MSDLKPFIHGEEQTHYACVAMFKAYGANVNCCGCSGHECKRRRISICSTHQKRQKGCKLCFA
jgi:hypothetical protein